MTPAGVPLITPPPDRFKPVGSEPEMIVQAYGGVPPVAVSVVVGYATPIVAGGSVVVVIVIDDPIVIDRLAVVDCDPGLSVALTVKLNGPETVGVPLITPVLAFIDKPLGSEPADTVHVNVVPAVVGNAATVCE